MTQDNDDILAMVWSGVSLPTDVKSVEVNHTSHTETTHFETSHVETKHVESHHEIHIKKDHAHEEANIDNHDDLLDSVRRATNSFREFVESSGVVEHEESHHEHHYEEVHVIGTGAEPTTIVEHHEEHHQNNLIGAGVEPVHAAIGHGVQVHDDGASVISVRTGVSQATSVSVHSSISQKSSIHGYDGVPPSNGPDLAEHNSVCSTEHTHEHESTICSGKAHSDASTLSQSTAVQQQYEIKAVAELNSHASTPVVPAKSATHDAVIEQFKHLHQRENSVCSSIQPSEVHLEEASVVSSHQSDEGRIMEVKVTKYNFDDDSVREVSKVLTKVTVERHEPIGVEQEVATPHEPVHHFEEHHYNAYHDDHHEDHHVEEHHEHHQEEDTGVQLLSYSHQEINSNTHAVHHHHGSEDEFGFEHVEYVEEKPHVAASGVSVKSAIVHNGPKLSHNVYETRRSIGSSTASESTVVEEAVNHVLEAIVNKHVVQEEVHVTSAHIATEHRDLIPNTVGPRVREDLRPVKIHRDEVVIAVSKKPVVAHVQPVVATQPEVHEHHHHHDEHYNAYEEHHHHQEHLENHDHHEEFHKEIIHAEPHREEEVMYGPSVRDLKSIFDHGEPVTVHYGYHSIHHGNNAKKNEFVVGEIHQNGEHHEHHHHEEVHVHHEPVEQVHAHVEEQHHHVQKHHHEDHHVHKHHHHHDKHEKKHRRHHSRSHSHKEHHHHEHQDHHVHKHHHEDHHAHKHHHHHHEEKVHHDEHVHQEQVHVVEEHIEVHEVHVPVQEYHAFEESVIPVSDALAIFGGGIRLRRPDHVEEQKSARSCTQSTCTTATVQVEEEHKKRSATQGTNVSDSKARAETIGSGVSARRSHAPTLTLVHQEHVEAPIVVASHVAPAPVAAQRSSSNEQFQSVRVVKSVRNFVSQWGNKDFVPPQSPIIAVPRLPLSPKKPAAEVFVEPPSSPSRKSTVTSTSASVVSSKFSSVAPSSVSKSSRSSTVTSATSTVCSNCPICLKQASSKSSKRSSVSSTISTSTLTSCASESTLVSHVEPAIHHHIHHESDEDFEIVPVSERRTLFEREHRAYSASFGRHGPLNPMVNLRE